MRLGAAIGVVGAHARCGKHLGHSILHSSLQAVALKPSPSPSTRKDSQYEIYTLTTWLLRVGGWGLRGEWECQRG